MFLDEIAFRHLLGKGEEIKYVAHVHAFAVYPKLFKVLLFGIALPVGGIYLMPPFAPVFLVWIALGALLFVYRVTQWYLDAWVVTNHGVIDQEWKSYFDKSTTRIDHRNIEGITTEKKGFWSNIMGYGNIQVEHVSGQPVVLNKVSNPRRLERNILLHQETYVRKQNFEDKDKLQDLLTNLLRDAMKNG